MDYQFGDYALDTERYELRRAGIVVKLRPKVFEVLAYLITHRERLVSKQELLEQLWPQEFVGEATLHSHIRAARQAVGDTGQAQRVIQTLHGRGFRFVADLDVYHPERRESARSLSPATASPVAPPSRHVPSGPVFVPADQEWGEVERLTATGVDAEHKAVTVLCAGVAGASALAAELGPEAMHRLMQGCLATAQQVLPSYGGTLTHITGEGFVALFGAPRAYEDHARRAVLAAVALQQALQAHQTGESLPVPLSIGVHTGPIVVGSLGADRQRLYTALGETIELAGRLRQLAAPGAILLSAATQQLVQTEVQVDDGGSIGVAGDAAAGPVYQMRRIVRRRSGVLGYGGRALSRFVGRERELALLHERLRHATQGQGQVIGIVGEPGIGKSRLLYEFGQSLRDRPVTYGEGHCLAYGSATPYLPIRDMLRQIYGIAETDGPDTITMNVHAHLHAVGLMPADEAPYLLSVLGVAADGDPLAALSPQEIRARTFVALQQFFLSSSRREALILAVENLHWIDPTSEEFLTSLVERISGAAILLLVTHRPGYRPAWLARSSATQLALLRLTMGDSLVLVQSVPQSAQIPDRLQQEIVGKAEGNPFFLEELARAAVLHDRQPATLSIPDTIQAVLAARIDRLAPLAKHLLQAAAVIGLQVPVPLLQAITSVPADTLGGSLRRLQSAEFLYETHLVPEQVYTFTHALTQEVAYGSLPHERRRAIHAQIVDALERGSSDRLLEHVEQLAHHAFQGERWDKAVTYCQQAGARAYDRAAPREAVAAFEQALQALAHLTESGDTKVLAIELRLALGGSLRILGEYGRQRVLLGEAEALARALDDRARLGQVLAGMTGVLRVTGDHDGAIAAAQQALDLATELGDRALQVHASHNLGQAYQAIGDFGPAAELLRWSVEAADRESSTPGTDVRILSRAWLALILSHLGAFAEGWRHGEEALRLAMLDGRGLTPIVAHGCLGNLYLTKGDLEHAIRVLDQSLALCRASGNLDWLRRILPGLGYAYALQGRLAEGRALVEETISEGIRTGAPQNQALWVAWLSEVCRLGGRGDEAWKHARQALDLARQFKERGNEAHALHQLGALHAHADPPDVERAETHYRQALALAEELGMRPLQAHCHRDLGSLYAKIGRAEQARAELATAIEFYRAMDMIFWLPGAEAALAGVATSASLDHGSGS